MYVIGSEQCDLPNSETPITQAEIDGQNAFIASVGSAFDLGNQAFNDLLSTLGGNPAGDTVSGAQGVPTTGTLDTSAAGIPVVPQPSSAPPMSLLPNVNDPSFWGWGDSPQPTQVVAGGRRRSGRGAARYGNVPVQDQTPPSGCPVIVPLVTAIPIPQGAPAPVSAPTPAAAPKVAPAVAPLQDCRTGNICIDLMNGCVLSSQVDPRQLQACSAAGYVGNKNLYPAIAAKGGADGGAFLGFPDPNPAPYHFGMSGFGQDSAAQSANASLFASVFQYVIGGLAAAAAIGILMKRKL